MPNQITLIRQYTGDGFDFLRISFDGDVVSPSDLKDIQLPDDIDFSRGIVIEGRAPIWVYTYLIHLLYPAAWVGSYDPRLGVVVAEIHNETDGIQAGDLLPCPPPPPLS